MTQIELMADCLHRDMDMLKMTLADFSDADMLVRPCPGANHAAWQLGHLVSAEAHLVNGIQPGVIPPAPASFSEKFKKETASVDDPSFFPKKGELLAVLTKSREATVAWLKTLKPSDLDRQVSEPINRFAPTVGHLFTMLPIHVSMHLGQFQVIRRKLGKPLLF